MTEEEKLAAFSDISTMFSLGEPILPNDFRKWGITSYREARELLREFSESDCVEDAYMWAIEEKPYKCIVIDPATGETRNGEVIAFYGKYGYAKAMHR